MMGPHGNKILLIEDEPQMHRFLRTSLTSHGYAFLAAVTLREGLQILTTQNPDVVLLDLGLPDGNGIDFIREVRAWTQTPIVVISARGQESDKVDALDSGADDYLTKPFSVNELLARLRVAIRHHSSEHNDTMNGVKEFGDMRIDMRKREVFVADAPVYLTPTEY